MITDQQRADVNRLTRSLSDEQRKALIQAVTGRDFLNLCTTEDATLLLTVIVAKGDRLQRFAQMMLKERNDRLLRHYPARVRRSISTVWKGR